MGGRLVIRWRQAARLAGAGAAAIAVVALLASAAEPSDPPPLPPDVGVLPHASSPAAPPAAGEDHVGNRAIRRLTRLAEKRVARHNARAARLAKPQEQAQRSGTAKQRSASPPVDSVPKPSPPPQPAPAPVAAAPSAPAPSGPAAAPSAPPAPKPTRAQPSEFGFER